MSKVLKTTCIMCPVGCSLTITKKNKEIFVTGNQCNRGEVYGKSEYTDPKRIVTSLVKTKCGIASVKTNIPVSKKLVFKVLKEISKIKKDKVNISDVLIINVLNTGANIIVTGIN